MPGTTATRALTSRLFSRDMSLTAINRGFRSLEQTIVPDDLGHAQAAGTKKSRKRPPSRDAREHGSSYRQAPKRSGIADMKCWAECGAL